MGYTIVTHFDAKGYNKLYTLLSLLSDERISRVPYGRVEDKRRYQVDTLPYHITISSSKGPLDSLMSAMEEFQFSSFIISIVGLDVMRGKNNSQVLYFEVGPSKEMEKLQLEMYRITGNDKYIPGKAIPHITLCISKDYRKIDRIKNLVLSDFAPFTLQVMSVGLYEVWPGKLISECHFKSMCS
jgi:2'-5' RNA ligase